MIDNDWRYGEARTAHDNDVRAAFWRGFFLGMFNVVALCGLYFVTNAIIIRIWRQLQTIL